MNFTKSRYRATITRLLAAATVVVSIAFWANLSEAWAYSGTLEIAKSLVDPQQQGRQPDANLPFLFAVFLITWGAFFAYMFVMSRRQKEMRREIEALQQVMAERERQIADSGPEPGARSVQ